MSLLAIKDLLNKYLILSSFLELVFFMFEFFISLKSLLKPVINFKSLKVIDEAESGPK